MTNLEDKIIKNRNSADNKEPRPGHMLRFFRKINIKSSPNIKVIVIKYGLVAAASVLIAILITGIVPDERFNSYENNIPEEISYVISYYESMSDKLVESMNNLNKEENIDISKIINDIKLYEEWKADIIGDFQRFSDDERVLNALIEFHKNKAEMLTDIYNQITGRNNESGNSEPEVKS